MYKWDLKNILSHLAAFKQSNFVNIINQIKLKETIKWLNFLKIIENSGK
jgi:hypothetical protein